MFSCICNEIIKDTDHIVIKHWFKVFSQLTKFINSILRCIKYKNTVVEFFDEIKCSVIQRTCVTTGFHHKKCCIFVCNFKWAMEKFTRMDNTYSIIFCYAASVMMDKIHYQNIMTNAFIITKTNPNLIGNQIISDLNRSYTTWTGESGYKKEPIQVIMTIISKYESQQLKQIVASEDPDAFITYTDHLEIIGNFEKRFDA